MDTLPIGMSLHHLWCPQRSENVIRYPETGVTDGYAIVWVLGIKPRSSARIASSLNP